MKIQDAVEFLDLQISNPSLGLPKELFFLVSRLTPLVNVDLLIKDENERVLLSWRNDVFVGSGWHVPGGIIRFKESIETRILKVAETEIGAMVDFDPVPVAINQVICQHNARGHFISILYKCFLSGKYIPENKGLSENEAGYLRWHKPCPANLIKVHEMYRQHM